MTIKQSDTQPNEFDQAAATWDESLYRAERARAIAQGIRERVPLFAQMTALEYGCGTGLLSFALQSDLGSIILADSSTGMLSVVQEKIAAAGIRNMTPLLVDLVSGPLPVNGPPQLVQLIYTLMTLHHIPDTAKILQAFYTLLESPGYLCVADLDAEDGSFHGADFTGHKGFERAALGSLAREAGFRKVQFTTIYHTPRNVGGSIKYFPLFLMIAEK